MLAASEGFQPGRLADLPTDVLEALLETLGKNLKPAVVTSSDDITGERARHQIAYAAGRYSVLTDIENALKAQERKAAKGRP